MNKEKWYLVLLATLVMLVPVAIPITVSALSSEESATVTEPTENFAFTDKKVIVLVDESKEAKYFSRLTQSTSKATTVSSINDQGILNSDVVLIDQSWLEKTDKAVYNDGIENIILYGIPVVTIGADPDILISILEKNDLSRALDPGCDAYGYIYDPVGGGTSSCNILCEKDGKTDVTEVVIGTAYNWGVKKAMGMSPREKIDPTEVDVRSKTVLQTDAPFELGRFNWNSQWQSADWFELYYQHTRGWINLVNAHYELNNDQTTTYDFWMSDFYLETVPKWDPNRYSTSDSVIRGNVAYSGQQNVRYDFDQSSQGQSTTSIELGFSYLSDGGMTIGINAAWSYTVQDVVLVNNCNMGARIYDWWHNLDESKLVAHSTYCANPGMVTRISSGATFYINENRAVTFCHFNGLWYDDFKQCTYNSGMHSYT
ncbi:MAG: hypothetical protein A4E31_01351 [Methanomassiliicoccales archaeon PtaU1.Bin030]|nr:MAG: hypothetical protein A4E31_01351 [Methanomassiliicoccales archaeon PtaU1.Bin030]